MARGLIARLAQSAGASPSALSRRQMLRASLACGASLMLAERSRSEGRQGTPKVVIIGAGFGGLSCGYQLARIGARVSLVEARPWVGGRVHSLERFLPGQIVEAGGEFIGHRHITWLAYARQFGLSLTDMAKLEGASSPIRLHGQRIIGEEAGKLWRRIYAVLQTMTADARRIDGQRPWLSPEARRLDLRTLEEASRDWPASALERHGVLTLLAQDLSCLPERTSYLGLLASIAAGGLEMFWSEREAYRCTAGNQALARALATAIGAANIHLRSPVAAIHLEGSQPRVILRSGEVLEAEAIVLTSPPSTWRDLEILPALPGSYRMSTGNGIKVLCRVDRPFWQELGLSGSSLSDGAIGLTWQGGEPLAGGPSEGACLSVAAGGQAAEGWLQKSGRERLATAKQELEKLFPGFLSHSRQQSFWLWPGEQWTRCCSSRPAPGEVTRVFPLLEAGWQGRLFFAGEYASPGFHGRMEGALHSGALLARRLAATLNIAT